MVIPLTQQLRDEYQHLFDTCLISPAHATEVEKTTDAIAANRTRYAAVGDALRIPWFFVGVVHCMEGSLDFNTHLHNGDPLTARTVNVPAGHPVAPPAKGKKYSWEESAIDSLTLKHFNNVDDWSLPAMLYRFEGYNGYGYRSPSININSPYLWSYSTHYKQGKFIRDHEYSPLLVSKQCGAAVLIRRMAERGIIHFDTQNKPVEAAEVGTLDDAVAFDPDHETAAAAQLQAALNHFPGISLAVDGRAGTRTSDALRRVTGHFLKGDPRAAA